MWFDEPICDWERQEVGFGSISQKRPPPQLGAKCVAKSPLNGQIVVFAYSKGI